MNQKVTKEQIGLEKISPSQLTTYEECPLLFYYQTFLGYQLPESRLHMDFGSAIHSALEVLYLKYDDNFGGAWQGQSIDEVERKFLDHWKPSMVTEEMFNDYSFTADGRKYNFKTPKQLYNFFKEDGLIIIDSYWREKERLLVEHGHDLKHFEIPNKTHLKNPFNRDEQLPIPLSYRIDAATKNWEKIVDFKTSKGKYNQKETFNKLQGRLYLLAHWSETEEFTGLFDYTVLRKQLKTNDRIEVVPLKYTMDDMAETYVRVSVILQKIANREFDAPSRGHPSYCRCRNYKQALQI